MARFRVRYAEGSSVKSNKAGMDQWEHFQAVHQAIIIDATSRTDAYIKVFQKLVQEGGEITVLHPIEGQSTPLGFTQEELEAIRLAGVPVTVGVPTNGFQIEQIIPEPDDTGS